MVEGVIAHGVAFLQHPFNQLRVLLGKFADHKKTGASFMLGQNIENAWAECRVGAVIEGEANGRMFGASVKVSQRFENNRRAARVGLFQEPLAGIQVQLRCHCYGLSGKNG